MKFDINSDLGEGFGRWKMGDDDALMEIVTSANIACGYHAGDAVIMTRMVELAKKRNVAIGAHIGLPDLLGFGRVPMQLPPLDMKKHAAYQLGALAAIAKVNGYQLTHANGHGAISKAIPGVMSLVIDVMAAFDKNLVMATNPVSPNMKLAREAGLRVVGKIYADRGYDDTGLLVSRSHPEALITDLDHVRRRVEQFANDGTVTTISGKRIKVDAKCFLIHSDTPGAERIAQTVKRTLLDGGAQLVPLTELAE